MSTTTTRGVARPASAKASPARPRRGLRGSSTFNFWLFTSPFLIGLTVFVYVPIGWSLWLSFFEARFTVTPSKFVGFDNYWQMLQDSKFTGSLVTFTVFAVFIVPATWALSLGLALLVNRLRFMKAFFRSVFFLPTACSYVAAALIWKMSMFSGVRFGLMNTILGWFGVENIAWLANPDPPWYWLVIVTLRLWLQAGFYMILFLAALQNIPPELYEAAAIDGAKPGWQTFRHITLPQLRATSTAVILLLVIAAYQAFDEFFNLLAKTTWGRPPLVELYYTALGESQDYGEGSAGAVILTLLILIVTLAQGKFLGFGRGDDK
ncbi:MULTISPECIES: carbohydrate ABC transporter permease [Streptomyces]|jgi:multiple sugar transport system permease protein|uniref:carbohydrate ABC transporter permease n=1 Tax=Streptomyces TaxID=1883 RepID=UPI000C703A31|nr:MULTISPECIES: sugar ABC transporter permease [unclassified Streptomyces]NMI61821.1 sugar ABC transporter permease [Streptomyces sp. RLA2-12]QDN60889.1 sugar ABC transporter permease [Streptomyces sp. S1D4-20]QDN70942.1 sugar ABC transporter permease [Streptomyces sp. S1D4-14]QDN81225.1 sugar ABC transporter permease [Streptomyces sp. S1A1-7]QDO53398.1 sugar ABC transporter permease [Streptomyces sp. RLB3-5]